MNQPRNSASSYALIYRDLRLKIIAGKLRPGERMRTEKELAATYGVSVLTVRQAQQGLIDEGLIAKQQGRGTFVTDRAAENRQVLLVCGLISSNNLSSLSISPFYQHTAEFCRCGVLASGLSFGTAWLENFPEGPAAPIDWHNLETYSGYLFLGCVEQHPVLEWARARGLNHVNVGKTFPGPNSVWYDPAEAARLAVAAVSDDCTAPVLAVSLPGTESGLRAIAGTGVIPLRAPQTKGAFEYECCGYELVRDACRGVPNARYVFLDDILARGGTRALLEAGIRPDRVAVVCGRQEVFPYGLPVTLVTHDTRQEADWSVAMLLAQISGEAASGECRQSHFQVTLPGVPQPPGTQEES